MNAVQQHSAYMARINDDYELSKAETSGYRISIRVIEKRWKLPRGKLANFRANLPRRKTPLPDYVDFL